MIDLDEVRSWAAEAGTLARRHFNHTRSWRKPDQSLVTDADKAIESLLVSHIRRRYPDHGIVGEEQTQYELDREFLWAIDPIDGTGSFVAGLPLWGVSIGVLRAGRPCIGVIYLPLLQACYWAGPDGAAHLDDQLIQVAAPRAWESYDWIAVPSNAHRRLEINFVGKTRGLGCTVAAICYVARGSAIGAVVVRSAIWDLAAALAVLHAAGGVAVGLSGQPLDIAPMIHGAKLSETVIIAAPDHVAGLRASIRERLPQST